MDERHEKPQKNLKIIGLSARKTFYRLCVSATYYVSGIAKKGWSGPSILIHSTCMRQLCTGSSEGREMLSIHRIGIAWWDSLYLILWARFDAIKIARRARLSHHFKDYMEMYLIFSLLVTVTRFFYCGVPRIIKSGVVDQGLITAVIKRKGLFLFRTVGYNGHYNNPPKTNGT